MSGNSGLGVEEGNTHLHFEVKKVSNLSSCNYKDPGSKVDPDNPDSQTWLEKLYGEYYSPTDVLNGTGEAKDWIFLLPPYNE